ncbi:hypothetical protein R5R35_005930 [Gryllus longicercus]|uniref:LDLR chaperone boca n=1 Tax=Gryllus longicercus TaxID=2509291 RepID=A0AAN9VCT7_9ORTH
MRYILLYLVVLLFHLTLCKKFKDEDKPAWAKKDIRDYNEADLERLLEQWEEDDEPLEPDELPEHLRPQPKVDFSQIDSSNPENLLKLTKKGRTVMMFVSVAGNPSKDETETVTKLWQSSLWNNHIQAERYLVDDDRAIFLFKDGAQAWEAKDFLVDQENCKELTLESKTYFGKGSNKGQREKEESNSAQKHKRKEDL